MKNLFHKKYMLSAGYGRLFIFDRGLQMQLAQIQFCECDALYSCGELIVTVSGATIKTHRLTSITESDYKVEAVQSATLPQLPQLFIAHRQQLAAICGTQLITIDPHTLQQQSTDFPTCTSIARFNKRWYFTDDNRLYEIHEGRQREVFKSTLLINGLQTSKDHMSVLSEKHVTVFSTNLDIVVQIQVEQALRTDIFDKLIVVHCQSVMNFYQIASDKKRETEPLAQIIASSQDIDIDVTNDSATVLMGATSATVPLLNKVVLSLSRNTEGNEKQIVTLQQLKFETVKHVEVHAQSDFVVKRQLDIQETVSQNINVLEQALRIEDQHQIDTQIKQKNYQLYSGLTPSLKRYFVKYLVQKLSPDTMPWLIELRETAEVVEQKDEIFIQLMQLKENTAVMKEIVQSAPEQAIGEIEPDLVLDEW